LRRAGLPGMGIVGGVELFSDGARQLRLCALFSLRRVKLARLKCSLLAVALVLLLVLPAALEAAAAATRGAAAAAAAGAATSAAAAAAAAAPAALEALYAEWLTEPPPDPQHCIGANGGFPTAPASERSGRAYVAPNCQGGIGNQVFCASAALAYALENDRCLVLGKIHVHPSSRAQVSYRDTVFRHLWLQDHLKPPGDLPGPLNDPRGQVVQPGLSMHWAPPNQPREANHWLAVMIGGWQHFWYTWRARATIARIFRPAPDVVRYLLRKYPELDRGVAMHFRRGDFIKSLPQYRYVNRDFPIPAEFFYRQAVAALLAHNATLDPPPPGGYTYFIFTNDYAWARAEPAIMGLPGKVVYVEEEEEVYSWYMMMLARKGVICANSTYCWWAAYIGHLARFIALPSHWYNSPGSEPTGIHFPGATVVHSDNARGEGPPPWYPRPWDMNDPEAGVVPLAAWPAPDPPRTSLHPNYFKAPPMPHNWIAEAFLFD
jgi:hypothetical protein